MSVAITTSIAASALAGCPADPATTQGKLTITGVVKRFEPGLFRQEFDTLGGVEVCVVGHDEIDCDTTESNGTYTLKHVPEDSNLLISFDKEEFVRGVRMLVTKESDYDILAETVLGELQLGIDQAELLGVDLSGVSGGGVQFFAARAGDGVLQAGPFGPYTATLTTLEGDPAQCDGKDGLTPCEPLYIGEDGNVDPDLTMASSMGVGGFGNVPPGEYLLRIDAPDMICDQALAESGWKSDDREAVRVKVIDGWATMQVGLFCQPPE